MVIALAALIGAVVTIGKPVQWVAGRYDQRFRWADRTEETLEALRPNVTAGEFDAQLGRPRIVTPSKSRKTTQRLYQGRGYWVQAVVDPNDTVLWFAVTVCSPKLRPSWRVWNGRDAYTEIKLQENNVVDALDLEPTGYQWNIPEATANEFIFALYHGGNTTNYQAYAWGYNDACDSGEAIRGDLRPAEMDALREHDSSEYEDESEYGVNLLPHGSDLLPQIVERLPDGLDVIFRRVRSNTFAIFGISQLNGDFQYEFQIGANRILTRTLME